MFDEELVKKWKEEDRKIEQESTRYIIQFEETKGMNLKAHLETLKEDGDVLFEHSLINAVTLEIKTEKTKKIASLHKMKDSRVKNVWKDIQVRIMTDVSIPLINANDVWERPDGNNGEGIVVAVIDTGVDKDHPDLKGRVLKSKDFTNEGDFDGNGHGTHVAGTIAGNGSASNGKYKGVAPGASIIAAKVLTSNGSGWLSGVIAGVEWSGENGAQVANLSLGAAGPCDGSDAMSQACNKLVDKGLVVCVAAGNSGPESMSVGTPGCAKKVTTIGASDDHDKIAYFSSRGPTSDGRVKPDVCFPGVGTVAARAKDTSMGSPVGEYYTSASGTSMATPHAAGTCAILLAKNLDLKPERVKELLMKYAIDMGYQSNTQGDGRGDVLRSFEDTGEEDGGGGGDGSPLPPATLKNVIGTILLVILVLFFVFVMYTFISGL